MDNTVRKTLANNVKSLREHHSWSQTDLAAKSGVKQTTISALEREVHAATIDTLAGLAGAFKVDPWALLVPGLPAETNRGDASRLLLAYVNLPASGRDQLSRVAEAEMRYHLGGK